MNFQEQLDADLAAVFLNVNEFAEPWTLTPPEGEPIQVNGIFDAAYQPSDPESSASVMGYGPALHVAESALPELPYDWRAVRAKNGKAYTVVEPKPDGQGMVVLRLREAS